MAETQHQKAFKLDERTGAAFFSRTSGGNLALVVPLRPTRAPSNRTVGGVSLSFVKQMRFNVSEAEFEAPGAILECLDPALEPTFKVLAREVAARVSTPARRADPALVKAAVASWERLLRARKTLSREEQIGLWGELWFLSQSPDLEKCIEAWGGPDSEMIDFAGGGIGIECKTSLQRATHFFSQAQLIRPLGDLPVFVVSIWVDNDPVDGKTISELAEAVRSRLTEDVEFERKLLETGYSRADASLYEIKLRTLEQPRFFSIDVVPRVREADEGVTNIRFQATLNHEAGISPERALELLAVLVGES